MKSQNLHPDAARATVVLIGFMGVGKSAIGRRAATLLGVPFLDSDELIERRHGAIEEIFTVHGEQVFRRLERDEVCRAIAASIDHPSVIALGGGAVLSGDVREELGRVPHVIWLTAPCDVLWARVRSSGPVRPLARDEQGFRRLFDERSALYASMATETLPNDETTTASVAGEVARIALLPAATRKGA